MATIDDIQGSVAAKLVSIIGRDLSESVAAQSTLWRFRQKLERGSLLERLRPEVNEQFAGQGVYIKSGEVSIVDASVIAAKQSRP